LVRRLTWLSHPRGFHVKVRDGGSPGSSANISKGKTFFPSFFFPYSGMLMLRAKGLGVRGGIKQIGSFFFAAIVVIVHVIRMPAAENPTFLLGMRTGAVESCALEKYLPFFVGHRRQKKTLSCPIQYLLRQCR